MWRQVKVHNVLSPNKYMNVSIYTCINEHKEKNTHALYIKCKAKQKPLRWAHSCCCYRYVFFFFPSSSLPSFSSFLYHFMHINWYVHATAVNYLLAFVDERTLTHSHTHMKLRTESKMLSMVLLFFCLSAIANWISCLFVYVMCEW